MDILTFILYGILFTTGFLSADVIIKKFSPQFFIEIQTKTKTYKAKIHHLYLSIAGILTYFFDIYLLTFFFIGIGVHDAIIEIKKKLKERLYKR